MQFAVYDLESLMTAIFEFFFSTEFVLWHYVFASSQHIRRHFSESSVLNSETKPILSRLTFIRAQQTYHILLEVSKLATVCWWQNHFVDDMLMSWHFIVDDILWLWSFGEFGLNRQVMNAIIMKYFACSGHDLNYKLNFCKGKYGDLTVPKRADIFLPRTSKIIFRVLNIIESQKFISLEFFRR